MAAALAVPSWQGHAAELAALEAKDPEFFKYLQENNSDLLNFDEDGEGEDEEDAEDEDDAEGEDEKAGSEGDEGSEDEDDEGDDEAAAADVPTVTLAQLKTLERSLASSHSLKALKTLVDMYRR